MVSPPSNLIVEAMFEEEERSMGPTKRIMELITYHYSSGIDLGKKMNHGTQNCGSQDLENQLSSSNVWYTDEGQSQQPFLQRISILADDGMGLPEEILYDESNFADAPEFSNILHLKGILLLSWTAALLEWGWFSYIREGLHQNQSLQHRVCTLHIMSFSRKNIQIKEEE
ncbi:hypothetical protein ACET3Z_004687 [Daucus carota]